jgi:chromosome segregation ATPase
MSAVPDNGQTREYPQTLSHFGETSEGEGEIGPAEDPESTVEERLAAAKAHRTQAETARQKIVSEIMEAARDLHQKLVSEGEQTLAKAKQLYADSELKHLQAQRKLERAQKAKAEAKAYQEKIIAQTQQEAQEILDQAQAIKAEALAFREKLLAEVQQQAQEELERAQVARVEADAYR